MKPGSAANMTSRELAILQTGADAFGVALDAAAVARLGHFLALLEEWNKRIHLTGDRDRDTLVRSHVVDSLAVVRDLPDRGMIIDIGTGAGFPGIVVACVRPTLDVVMLDSRRRPVSFLNEVIRTLPLGHARVLQCRAEDASRAADLADRAAVVVARALRLDVFLRLARPLLAANGVALAMQTPRTAVGAGDVARVSGLRLSAVRPYVLPGDVPRVLVACVRAGS